MSRVMDDNANDHIALISNNQTVKQFLKLVTN